MIDLSEITRASDKIARFGVHEALTAGFFQRVQAQIAVDELYWQAVCELRFGFRPVLMLPPLMATLRSLEGGA